GYANSLFSAYEWWNLVPDQSHQLVTAGYGTYASDNADLTVADYVTAASTPDGSLAIAYCPTATTITVDLAQFARPVVAKWYDPSDGSFQSIAGSLFGTSGPHDFTTPGPNGDDNDDWVLVLD